MSASAPRTSPADSVEKFSECEEPTHDDSDQPARGLQRGGDVGGIRVLGLAGR
jgi:hypothetical protein